MVIQAIARCQTPKTQQTAAAEALRLDEVTTPLLYAFLLILTGIAGHRRTILKTKTAK